MDKGKDTKSRNHHNLFAAFRLESRNKDEDNQEAETTDDILAKLDSGENPLPPIPEKCYEKPGRGFREEMWSK